MRAVAVGRPAETYMQKLVLMRNLAWDLVARIARRICPAYWKGYNELSFWKRLKKEKGGLHNSFYEFFYTTHFGLDKSFYKDKILLDVGCGPSGSLEWASMASRRIGLDPLAKKYLKLGASRHEMEYIDAPSEAIPLENARCDAVFSFNSLDHVEDVEQTMSEIKRVTKPGGILLLLVDVNHPPNDCEPHELSPDKVVELLQPEFVCEDLQVYRPVVRGMYQSIRAGEKFPHPEKVAERGYLSARFIRVTSGT